MCLQQPPTPSGRASGPLLLSIRRYPIPFRRAANLVPSELRSNSQEKLHAVPVLHRSYASMSMPVACSVPAPGPAPLEPQTYANPLLRSGSSLPRATTDSTEETLVSKLSSQPHEGSLHVLYDCIFSGKYVGGMQRSCSRLSAASIASTLLCCHSLSSCHAITFDLHASCEQKVYCNKRTAKAPRSSGLIRTRSFGHSDHPARQEMAAPVLSAGDQRSRHGPLQLVGAHPVSQCSVCSGCPPGRPDTHAQRCLLPSSSK